ncbi:26S proteasome non-ATPase regulatory subunit 12 [Strongylocentrotus purpuratus]|uniref:PCI domain-containing protein n=1 Tax=Strongylocentrotus purpuratus TaxID=7668 RepID=A0A7M7SY81_STRPU|nr:26S proteasome non-ATPase regulatory subunit 12 [Strongylocentrotus purpuratus]
MAEDGRIQKMEVDYTETVDKRIPECEQLGKDGKLTEALEILLSLEKQSRTAADMHSTARVLVAIVKLCFEARDWDALNEHIVLLSKRRSQLKQAVVKMVQESCTYVEQTPDMETKLKLIDTLRTVTAGKIYVEIERARLTMTLAKIKEGQGEITEAADILQDLQVETFGSMEKKEKVEFILDQMRLCLAKKDYIRTQIISKKVSSKFFDSTDEEVQEQKLKFYKLMIELDQHEGAYLDICKHYRAVYDTPLIQKEDARWKEGLKNAVLYLILAPFDNEQSDLIHRVSLEKKLEDIPKYRDLLKCFTTPELMRWQQVCAIYETELKKGSTGSPPTDVFAETEQGTLRWKDLRNRVVEHNIRVMAKYYTRITTARMGELLELSGDEAEAFLSKLVEKKTIYAKVDRLAGIVDFMPHKDPNDILNSWSNNLNDLMHLVNKTTHLINKEEMQHQFAH